MEKKMLEKKDVYAILDEYGFSYESYEHPAVYTIEEVNALEIPYKEVVAKNLFLREDKGRKYYLVVLPGHKTANLKALGENLQIRRLNFASEEKLWEILGLKKGHVTPLGILNNEEKNVIVVFDRSLQGKQIGIHPMENTATVILRGEDIIKLVEDHGNKVLLCDFD